MAKQLGRGTAGRRVLGLAQAFSDDLLGDEEDTFERMDVLFGAPVVGQARRVRNAAERRKDIAGLTGDAALITALDRAQRAVIAACTPQVVKLAGVAADKGLAAIGKELAVCEETMPRRYAGITDLAVDAALGARRKILANVTAAYGEVADSSAAGFKAEVRVQIKAADTLEHLIKRLFSPEPAGLRGFGGRGIWWRADSELQAAAREVSTRTANLTRGAAMYAWNELAKDRRDA